MGNVQGISELTQDGKNQRYQEDGSTLPKFEFKKTNQIYEQVHVVTKKSESKMSIRYLQGNIQAGDINPDSVLTNRENKVLRLRQE